MGPTDFVAFGWLQWAVLLGCGGLICFLLLLVDPSAIPPAVILFALGAILLFWAQERMRHRPHRVGLRETPSARVHEPTADVPGGSESHLDAAASPDLFPICAKCGLQSEIGDVNCSRCGAMLWDRPQEPEPQGAGPGPAA